MTISCCSVTKSCLTWRHHELQQVRFLHCLPEFAQTYIHWVSDAIQSSHPLLPPSLPALNLSQHQDCIQWVGLHQVVKVLVLWHQSFQWYSGWFSPSDWRAWSPCSPRDSQESSPAPQFKSICSLMLSFLYGLTLTSVHDYWENHNFDCMDLCWQSDVSAF